MPIDWQPISSAPKDRPVMTYVPDGMWGGGNPYLVAEWYEWSEGETGWLTTDDPCDVEPTHWCEMNPPAEKENADAV